MGFKRDKKLCERYAKVIAENVKTIEEVRFDKIGPNSLLYKVIFINLFSIIYTYIHN